MTMYSIIKQPKKHFQIIKFEINFKFFQQKCSKQLRFVKFRFFFSHEFVITENYFFSFPFNLHKTSTILVLMMATILVSAQSYSSPTKNIIQQQYEPSGGSSGSDEFGHERMVGRVIPLAVKTRQTFDFIPVDIPMERTEPYIIEVGANSLPLVMQFKSASSRLQIEQNHAGSGLDRMVETTSEDQPKHLRHKVVKPIIQVRKWIN